MGLGSGSSEGNILRFSYVLAPHPVLVSKISSLEGLTGGETRLNLKFIYLVGVFYAAFVRNLIHLQFVKKIQQLHALNFVIWEFHLCFWASCTRDGTPFIWWLFLLYLVCCLEASKLNISDDRFYLGKITFTRGKYGEHAGFSVISNYWLLFEFKYKQEQQFASLYFVGLFCLQIVHWCVFSHSYVW